jgi:hypothetical protein
MKVTLTFDPDKDPDDAQRLNEVLMAPNMSNLIWELQANVLPRALKDAISVEDLYLQITNMINELPFKIEDITE